VSVSTFIDTPLHVVLVSILGLAHLSFGGPGKIFDSIHVYFGFPFVQVSVSKLVSSFFDTVFSPVFLSSFPVSSSEFLSKIRVSSEIPVTLSSRHSSAESPSVNFVSITPPCLWVAGSLDSPSLSGGSSLSLSDSLDSDSFSHNFSNFLSSSSNSHFSSFLASSLVSVLVLGSISGSGSLSIYHDPSPAPSPSPDPSSGCSVPFISISGSGSLSHLSGPSPLPFPLEFLASVASSSSFPVASAPVPLVSHSFAVNDSPFPSPLSLGDSSSSPFPVESISNSLSSDSSPSPFPSSG